MGQKVLINVEAEDIRVAIMEEGILTDLFVENRNQQTIVGNIYKGVVMDVIPGIQAAFVDFGVGRVSGLGLDVHRPSSTRAGPDDRAGV